MIPQQLSRVEDRFYRADKSGNISGAGLEISIINKLTNIHDGRLKIESTLGQGTIVTLWLPIIVTN
jgi:signal transduction histidine kinase